MNITTNRFIFLDFDGVLFDTVREVYAIAMLASGHITRASDVDYTSKHFELFDKLRYLVGPAWNYYYLIRCIDNEKGGSMASLKSEYKKFLDQSSRGDYTSFEERFFQARKQLRELDSVYWMSLIFPYSFVKNIRVLIDEFRNQFFIVTTRDRDSVLDLLRFHDLNILDSNIFTRKEHEIHGSKANLIQNLINKLQIDESIFVDDLEGHLGACESIEKLSTIQAKWGYVAPQIKEDNSLLLFKKLKMFIHGQKILL